jgi:hypothetical protein
MTIEIPQYALKAYALLFSRYSTNTDFSQSELDWFVSESMKKKIFALLLHNGWIKKSGTRTYTCTNPADAITGLLDFRIPEVIKTAERTYAFTQLSAVEIWSDFCYVLRGREKSPYFIKVFHKDVPYWKDFFHRNEIPNYIQKGTTIGEFVILIPVDALDATQKEGYSVESLKATMQIAQKNMMYKYPYEYMVKKYGTSSA